MKYSDKIPMKPPTARLLRLDHAAAYLAGEANLRAAIEAGWIKPTIRHSGCTAYDVKDLDAVIDRAKLEGKWPTRLLDKTND